MLKANFYLANKVSLYRMIVSWTDELWLKNIFNITIKDRPHLKKVGDWTDLRLKFEVLDEKSESQISQFHFEGPHAEANMEAHAHNVLLAFVEFLESVYGTYAADGRLQRS